MPGNEGVNYDYALESDEKRVPIPPTLTWPQSLQDGGLKRPFTRAGPPSEGMD